MLNWRGERKLKVCGGGMIIWWEASHSIIIPDSWYPWQRPRGRICVLSPHCAKCRRVGVVDSNDGVSEWKLDGNLMEVCLRGRRRFYESHYARQWVDLGMDGWLVMIESNRGRNQIRYWHFGFNEIKSRTNLHLRKRKTQITFHLWKTETKHICKWCALILRSPPHFITTTEYTL